MTPVLTAAESISAAFIADVRARLAAGCGVRRRLPGGGRLHIDRRLPFLLAYRERGASRVGESARMVVGEAAYLMAPGSPEVQPALAELVTTIGGVMREAFGGFLLLELWTRPQGEAPPEGEGSVRTVQAPTFRVHTAGLPPDDAAVRALHRALAEIPLRPPPLDVEVAAGADACASAPSLPPLLPPDAAARGLHALGIEVQPVYRQARTGVPYPAIFEALRRGLALAVRQAAFQFAVSRGAKAPAHFHAYGRRVAVREAERVDAELTDVARSFDFLLQVTPVNATRARAEFERGGGERAPAFDYRPLAVDGDRMKRRLYDLPLERLEDPTLAGLLRATREELARTLTMLDERNTPNFLYGSLAVFGTVDPPLLALARSLLARLAPPDDEVAEAGDDRAAAADPRVDAAAFAARAEAELARYREQHPGLAARVEVRDDVSGLMVAQDNLLVGRRLRVPAARVEALLQHEVGTHVLTWANGSAQPLGQFATGLAGYEELQEGLAVLAEHLVDGLDPARLRLLAARVVAVRAVIDGADFVETHRLLVREHGVGPATAFTIAMRVHRSGGLTKDAVYLRGLVRLLAHLAAGGGLEDLYVGKVSFAHLADVRELRWREYLRPPLLHPRVLDHPGAADRLARLRTERSVLDLLPDGSR